MSDDLKGQNDTEGTVEPMPSSEQPVEGEQEDVNPRTAEQFEKLTAHNKALADELNASREQLARLNSSSFQFDPTMLDSNQSNGDFDTNVPEPIAGATSEDDQDFVDDGGNVDIALLNSKLAKAEKDARDARAQVNNLAKESRQERIERQRETVYAQVPEVNPSSDQFDPDFDKKVKLELTRQIVETGKQDYLAAAKEIKRLYPKAVSDDEAKREQTISAREQASAQTGTSKGSSEAVDQEDLVSRTMKGDADAIYKRLQASGN